MNQPHGIKKVSTSQAKPSARVTLLGIQRIPLPSAPLTKFHEERFLNTSKSAIAPSILSLVLFNFSCQKFLLEADGHGILQEF